MAIRSILGRLVSEHDWGLDQTIVNVLNARWEQWIGRINAARYEPTLFLMTWNAKGGRHISAMVTARSLALFREQLLGERTRGQLMGKALLQSKWLWEQGDLAYDLAFGLIKMGRMPIEQVAALLKSGLSPNSLELMVQRLVNKYADADSETMETIATLIGCLGVWQETAVKIVIKSSGHRESGVRRAAIRAVTALLEAHPVAFAPLIEAWSKQLFDLYRKEKDSNMILNALLILLQFCPSSAPTNGRHLADFVPVWMQQLDMDGEASAMAYRGPILLCLSVMALNHPSLVRPHLNTLLALLTQSDANEVRLLRDLSAMDEEARRAVASWTMGRLKQLLDKPTAEHLRHASDLVGLAGEQTWPLIKRLSGRLAAILHKCVTGPFNQDYLALMMDLMSSLILPLSAARKQLLFPFLDEVVELLFRLNRLEIGKCFIL